MARGDTPKEKTDALVQTVADAAVANLERLFARARISIEGRKLTARNPYEWNESGATWRLKRGDLPGAINAAYQWYPAQFYAGIRGLPATPHTPDEHAQLGGAVSQVGAKVPAAISQGIWEIVAEEIREDLNVGTEESLSTISGRIQDRYARIASIDQLHIRVLKEVRERLNWPPGSALPRFPVGPSRWEERF